jgi:hypothetical protein
MVYQDSSVSSATFIQKKDAAKIGQSVVMTASEKINQLI